MAEPLIGVVDYDDESLHLIDEILSGKGFRTLLLMEGSNPYQTIVQEMPDLIMVDTSEKTHETGWALLHLLKRDPKTAEIPILICGSNPREVASRSENLPRRGVTSLLGAPFDAEALIARVSQMLDGRPSDQG